MSTPARAGRSVAAGGRGRGVERRFRSSSGLRVAPGGVGVQAGGGPDRRHQGQRVAHMVEDGDQRRADQHRLGDAEHVRVLLRQPLDLADHVVAEIAEQPRRDGRQPGRHRHAAGLDQGAQAVHRRRGLGREGMRGGQRVAVDLGPPVAAAPDQVGRHADGGESAARRAAFHALQQEGVRPALRQPQEGADRRVEVGDAFAEDRLAASGGQPLAEGGGRGHGVTCCIRVGLMRGAARARSAAANWASRSSAAWVCTARRALASAAVSPAGRPGRSPAAGRRQAGPRGTMVGWPGVSPKPQAAVPAAG